MRVCKYGSDTTRILISYVLPDARFDCLVGNLARIKKIYFAQEVNKQYIPSFVELFSRNIL